MADDEPTDKSERPSPKSEVFSDDEAWRERGLRGTMAEEFDGRLVVEIEDGNGESVEGGASMKLRWSSDDGRGRQGNARKGGQDGEDCGTFLLV